MVKFVPGSKEAESEHPWLCCGWKEEIMLRKAGERGWCR